MQQVQWFVECDPFGNEPLAELLNAQGIGKEAEFRDLVDNVGKPHDVWLIPPTLVSRLRRAEIVDPRLKFKFFKRNGTEGPIYSGEFIKKRRKSIVLREAVEEIKRLKSRM